MGLVVKLQTMQQVDNHFSDIFFKSEEYSHMSIGIELVFFYYYCYQLSGSFQT